MDMIYCMFKNRYQFMCWFDGYQLENIISDYKEGIDSFLSQKYK